MKKRQQKTVLLLSMLAALSGGCFHAQDDEHVMAKAKYHVYAVDHSGYINIYGDDGEVYVGHLASIQPKNANNEALGLGEVHFNKGKAFVIVQSNMTDSSGTVVGGGVIVVDVATQKVEHTIPFASNETANITRLVHSYPDPNGNYLWINNDGPSGNADADSVFRFNWNLDDADDTDGDKYLDVTEIATGNGHKKGAFAFNDSNIANSVTVPLMFASHNLSDQSVSLINNDPESQDFLNVTTIDFGPYVNGDTSLSNTPHGLEYSPLSGKFYIGITPGQDMGVAVIDANNLPADMAAVRAGSIMAGSDVSANQVPAGGYIHTSMDHKFLYMVGKKDGKGYLSVIDATNDTVVDVIDYGNVSASSFVFAHGEMDHGDTTMHINKVYVGASVVTTNGAVDTTWAQNVIKVIEIDPATGGQKAGTEVKSITTDIGNGTAHRNGKGTPDGMHVYMPNGGGNCEDHATMDADCSTISVIETMGDKVITKIKTQGHMPGSMGIVDVSDLTLMFTVGDHDQTAHTH
ncbi:MAG: hypothetical protein OEZ43_11850 [Gammaproteobacteria bacterium]|nr:hypothetical protein [Gammaproteobacteria bacterium]